MPEHLGQYFYTHVGSIETCEEKLGDFYMNDPRYADRIVLTPLVNSAGDVVNYCLIVKFPVLAEEAK